MIQIVWFKKDLRVHDHPALYEAAKHVEETVFTI